MSVDAPDADQVVASDAPLVLACGALASELRAVLRAAGLDDRVEVDYLPAPLHNRPDRIVSAVEERLGREPADRHVLLGYADCGTGGRLDSWLQATDRTVTRLPGAHCYELFAGGDRFAAMHDAEPGTFYLTDFLAKHFDALVWQGLGLDRHPELRDMLFGNYQRLVFLAQRDDADTLAAARRAADLLGLDFEHQPTGLAPFAEPVQVALRTALGGQR